jgi:hypothetical protein
MSLRKTGFLDFVEVVDALIGIGSKHAECPVCWSNIYRNDDKNQSVLCSNRACDFKCTPHEYLHGKSPENQAFLVRELKEKKKYNNCKYSTSKRRSV